MMLRSFSRRKGSADTVMLLSLHSSSLEGSASPTAVASTAAGPQQQASRAQSPTKAILSPAPSSQRREGGGGREASGEGASGRAREAGAVGRGRAAGEPRFPPPEAACSAGLGR